MNFEYKYAPRVLDEVIISDSDVRYQLDSYIRGENIKPLILHGSYGTGKTTIAKLLPNEMEGKPVLIEFLRATEFNSIGDVTELFGCTNTFYKLFTIEGQLRNYVVSNEVNFTPKAAVAFRDVVDEMMLATQFIFTTNNIEMLDAGLLDRCTKVFVSPAQPHDWLPRIKWILKQEGVKLSDAKILNFLTAQLSNNSSNRSLLRELEDVVFKIKNPQPTKVAASKPIVTVKMPAKSVVKVFNPLSAT
jgi:DNA polymerase III delta prime subunit